MEKDKYQLNNIELNYVNRRQYRNNSADNDENLLLNGVNNEVQSNTIKRYISKNINIILLCIISTIAIINICLVFYFIGITAPILNKINSKINVIDPIIENFNNILLDAQEPVEIIKNNTANITDATIETLDVSLSLVQNIHKESMLLFTNVEVFLENISKMVTNLLVHTNDIEDDINSIVKLSNTTMYNLNSLVLYIFDLITPPED